jgi:hypothetical protein
MNPRKYPIKPITRGKDYGKFVVRAVEMELRSYRLDDGGAINGLRSARVELESHGPVELPPAGTIVRIVGDRA